MNEDSPRQAVRVSPLLSSWPGGAVPHPPVEGEQRALSAAQLAQRRGEAVLPRVGGELPQDQGGGHGALMRLRRLPAGFPANDAMSVLLMRPRISWFEATDRPHPCRCPVPGPPPMAVFPSPAIAVGLPALPWFRDTCCQTDVSE